MSGTSIDGIDAGLIEFKDDKIQLLAFEHTCYPEIIKKQIKFLSYPDNPILLKDYGYCDSSLGCLFAQSSNNLLNNAKISHTAITAIGSHGQTIYHAPNLQPAFSIQIGDPNIIAEKTGITTVADFRRRDIAAGGQGAPLVPAFHQVIFGQIFDLSKQSISVVNIGGIANITYLSANKAIGFDAGPGNTLMDLWAQKYLNLPYDKNGSWAKDGVVNVELLKLLKQDVYFNLVPPKSTGTEYFSSVWLDNKLSLVTSCNANDIQTTLCHFTADIISEAICQYAEQTQYTLVCGGGAYNDYLLSLISKNLAHPVASTNKFGINPSHVEVMAFAWLAKQTINHKPGNLTKVTGAKYPVILGGVYFGGKLHRK